MTILAQLNDCHSCNDAGSIVQKKKSTHRSELGGTQTSSHDVEIQRSMEQLITLNKEEVAFSQIEAKKFTHTCENMLSLHASLQIILLENKSNFYANIKMPHATTHCSFEPMPLFRLVPYQCFIKYCYVDLILRCCCYAGPAFTFSFAMFAVWDQCYFLLVRFGALQVKTSKNECNSWHRHQ